MIGIQNRSCGLHIAALGCATHLVIWLNTERVQTMSSRKVSKKGRTSRPNRCILLLWGEQFDEVAATIFTVSLRKVGLCVKVVGVDGLLSNGYRSVGLYADVVLSEVAPFVDNMLCLIMPCSRTTAKRFDNDPLVQELFAAAVRRQAKFVLSDHSVIKNSSLNALAIPSEDVTVYAQVDDLMAFAKEVATTLLYMEGSPYSRTAPMLHPTAAHLR